MNRVAKKVLLISSILLVLILIAGFVAGNFFYVLALDPHADKSKVLNASHNALDWPENPLQASIDQWKEETPFIDEYRMSEDGLNLHAYLFENKEPSHRWVILAHGYNGNATNLSGASMEFYHWGYNLLKPDARGHGLSEGEYIGMGWHERRDMLGWIDSILEKDPKAQIVLYGVSMGAATVMMTAGEDLPPNVKAVVEDCGYTSAKEEFSYQLKEIFGLPSFPVMDFSSGVTKIRAGYFLGEASAVKQLEKAKVPILFIHGDQDTFVPSYMLDKVYAASPAEKEKFLVSGAGHGMSSLVAGEEYWNKVNTFIQKYIET